MVISGVTADMIPFDIDIYFKKIHTNSHVNNGIGLHKMSEHESFDVVFVNRLSADKIPLSTVRVTNPKRGWLTGHILHFTVLLSFVIVLYL